MATADKKFNDLFSSDSDDDDVDSGVVAGTVVSKQPVDPPRQEAVPSQSQTRDNYPVQRGAAQPPSSVTTGGGRHSQVQQQPPPISTSQTSISSHKSTNNTKQRPSTNHRRSRSRSRSPQNSSNLSQQRRPKPLPSSRIHSSSGSRRDRRRRSNSRDRSSYRSVSDRRDLGQSSSGRASRSSTTASSSTQQHYMNALRLSRPSTTQILSRHTGGSHPVYPYQLTCLKSTSSALQQSSHDLSKTDVDYMRAITGRARTHRDKQLQDAQTQAKIFAANQPDQDSKFMRGLEQRARECLTVATFFQVMNETKWLMLDDEFYIVSRRWFENWKGFVSYDYVLRKIVTEQRRLQDLSINQIILQGRANPGEVSNWSLLLESGKFFNRSATKDEAHFSPLKEGMIDGREFFIVPKSVWRFFYTTYRGPEIKRYSIVKNRQAQLYRTVKVPMVTICLMRRGDQCRQPKPLPLALRTTLEAFKSQVCTVFPQILNDWGCRVEYLSRDMRVWLLRENEMSISEFISSYNSDIVNSSDQSFNFPGRSLEQKRHSLRSSNDILLIEEIATLLALPQTTPGIICIEVKRHDKPWLFSLDEYDDQKFYRSVTSPTNPQHSSLTVAASQAAVQVLQAMPYLAYLPEFMTDREYFGGQGGKDAMVFSFNNYWKTRNYLAPSSLREYNVSKYPTTGVYYAAMMPQQAKEDVEIASTLDQSKLLQQPQTATKPQQSSTKSIKTNKTATTKPIPTLPKEQTCVSCDRSRTKEGKKISLKCQNCKSVSYCDTECQRKDSRFHEGKVCAELREDYYVQLRKAKATGNNAATTARTSTNRESSQEVAAAPPVTVQKKEEVPKIAPTLAGKKRRQRPVYIEEKDSSTQTEDEQSSQSPEKVKTPPKLTPQPMAKKEDESKDKPSQISYCEGNSPTPKKKPVVLRDPTPIKPSKTVTLRKRDQKKKQTASKAPVVKFNEAQKQPGAKQVSPQKPQKSLAAELASSDSSSDTETESELTVSRKASAKASAKKEKQSSAADESSSALSEDEEIEVDLKSDKRPTKEQQKETDEEDDNELTYRRDMFQRRHGLSNLGNSCYMNCIIQILAHLVLFKEELKKQLVLPDLEDIVATRQGQQQDLGAGSSEATTSVPSSSEKGDNLVLDMHSPKPEPLPEVSSLVKKQICDGLQALIAEISNGKENQTIVDPTLFKEALATKNQIFRGTEQFDASEFVQILFELLDRERLEEQSVINAVLKSRLKVEADIFARPSLAAVFQGLLKQTITCQKCHFSSFSMEPFQILSLPIETEEVNAQKKAHIKVMYIFDDKYLKYDFYLKAGKYTISMILEKVRQRAAKDRKEIKSGKKTVVFADLKQSSILTKFFTESLVTFNFVPGQQLTTYAFEVDRKLKDRLHSVNFIHLTKQEYSLSIRKYFINPRIVNFTENDSVRVIGFKIYKAMIGTLGQALQASIQALTCGITDGGQVQDGVGVRDASMDPAVVNSIEDEATMKQNYEDLFINRKVDVNNMPMPPPYELFALYRDGKREKMDPRQSKKLGKAYDMHNLHRIDVEFPMQADFGQMKAAFETTLTAPPSAADLDLGGSVPTTELTSCIKSFAKPELLTGANRWRCDSCDELQDAKKSLSLEKSPDILFVQLKRFKFVQDKFGNYRKEKLDTMVKFDRKLKLRKLFEQPRIEQQPQTGQLQTAGQAPSVEPLVHHPEGGATTAKEEEMEERYMIQGVVHHQSTSTLNEGGHFLSYCYNEYDSDWCKYDDNQVKSSCSDTEVTNKDAYILVYRKARPDEKQQSSSKKQKVK